LRLTVSALSILVEVSSSVSISNFSISKNFSI
jgi:hypothetical protein